MFGNLGKHSNMSNFLVLQTMAINLADVITICRETKGQTDKYYIHRRNMDTIVVNSDIDRDDFKALTAWFTENRPKSMFNLPIPYSWQKTGDKPCGGMSYNN